MYATELTFLVYIPRLGWLPQCTMTDDASAIGEQIDWLVLVELLVLLVRLELGTDRQTIRGEHLSL
jgi:hypothetical protein